MYNYEFYGRIIPEGLNLGFKDNHVINVSSNELGIYGSITFGCINSIASIFFTTERKYNEDLLPTIRNIVCEYGRLIIDFYCYCRSINCDLDIQGVRCKELGIDRKFSIQLETDIKIGTQTISSRIDKILSIISRDKKLFLLGNVFGDFRRAIKEIKMTGFYFYRAIETIRSNFFDEDSIADSSIRKKSGWKKMNFELGIDNNHYTDLIKYATSNRHGEYPSITGEERIKLAKDTRYIIEKFINYIEKI